MIKNSLSTKWLIAVFLIFLSGCSGNKEILQTGLVNEWIRTEKQGEETEIYILEFESDGDFYLRLNENESDGSFTLKENQLIIESRSCSTIPGVYNFYISEAGVLTLSIAEDLCSSRIQHLVGKWLRK